MRGCCEDDLGLEGGELQMGMYLNPGNSGFAEKLKTEYVDKTELIGLINRSIEK